MRQVGADDLDRVLGHRSTGSWPSSAEVDGVEPVDEAARMSLVRHGLADNALWLTDDGFALVRGHDLDVAVAPDARGHGEGRALAEAALDRAPRREVTAWSHADHPAAAALARRFGFSATRALWVMTREARPPSRSPTSRA